MSAFLNEYYAVIDFVEQIWEEQDFSEFTRRQQQVIWGKWLAAIVRQHGRNPLKITNDFVLRILDKTVREVSGGREA